MNIIVLVVNTILGVVLGKAIPDYGVVISWGLSYMLGSVFLILHYQKRTGYSFKDAIKSSDYVLIVSALIFTVLSRFVFLNIAQDMNFSLPSLFLFFLVYSSFFITVAYFNRNFRLLNVFQYLKR
jgi:peptidoglycan biosynthesis protein MviN/MurJ (putative lipid II flippase)